mmetsp:Transcript_30159/g.38907  ORF Transcript_30159/g.38907 Transcript_30159/m.38907 type:complete len:179 (+) Transcript_30159:213-749(+)
MVSKSIFRDLSLEHHNGNYFLRPDRILGAFYVDPKRLPVLDTLELVSEVTVEKNRENQVFEKLRDAENKHHNNATRVDTSIASLWNRSLEIKKKEKDNIMDSNQNKEIFSSLSSNITPSLSRNQNTPPSSSSISDSVGGDIEMNYISSKMINRTGGDSAGGVNGTGDSFRHETEHILL